MTTARMMRFIDATAVTIGVALLLTVIINVTQAEAAMVSGAIFSAKASQPWIAFAGFTFTTFPFSRRLAAEQLGPSASLADCDDVGEALRRIALQQRVQTGNLYLVDMPDDVVARAFDTPNGMWEWLAPAYADPALRRQINPRLLARLETMAAEQGTPQVVQG